MTYTFTSTWFKQQSFFHYKESHDLRTVSPIASMIYSILYEIDIHSDVLFLLFPLELLDLLCRGQHPLIHGDDEAVRVHAGGVSPVAGGGRAEFAVAGEGRRALRHVLDSAIRIQNPPNPDIELSFRERAL